MRIAALTPAELPRFIEAARRRYGEQMVAYGELTPAEAERRVEADSRGLFPAGTLAPGHAVLVGREEGVVVGEVWVGPHRLEPSSAFVYHLVVAEAKRRCGYGTALLGAAQDWARERGFRGIALSVFADNEAARRLYASLGYEPSVLVLRRPL